MEFLLRVVREYLGMPVSARKSLWFGVYFSHGSLDSIKKRLDARVSVLGHWSLEEFSDERVVLVYSRDDARHRVFLVPVPSKAYKRSDLTIIPVILIIHGESDLRNRFRSVSKYFGLRRGWVSQYFLRNRLDHVIRGEKLRANLISLGYELRAFTKEGWVKREATSTFRPKGFISISDAIREREAAEKQYVFVTNLYFSLVTEGGIVLGNYIVTHKAEVGVLGANPLPALKIFTAVLGEAVRNYYRYTVRQRTEVRETRSIKTYSVVEVKEVFLKARNPGSDFFNAVVSFYTSGRPLEDNQVVIPIKVGNPVFVVKVIDKAVPAAAVLIISYKGIRITPVPGVNMIPPAFVEKVIRQLQAYLAEE